MAHSEIGQNINRSTGQRIKPLKMMHMPERIQHWDVHVDASMQTIQSNRSCFATISFWKITNCTLTVPMNSCVNHQGRTQRKDAHLAKTSECQKKDKTYPITITR